MQAISTEMCIRDRAKTAAHHLEQMLSERGLKAAQEHEGQAHFYVSDVPDLSLIHI